MHGHADIVVVSPHRDDAAFSCGIVLHSALQNMAVRIVNVFTRSVYAPFNEAVERLGIDAVSQLRQGEDDAAIAFLRSTVVPGARLEELNLGMLDAPLRLHVLMEDVQGDVLTAAQYQQQVHTLAIDLQPLIEGSACVLLPLGLGGRGIDGHIDHRIVRDAGRRCTSPARIAFYEDLPYAVRMNDVDRTSVIAVFLSSNPNFQQVHVQRANARTLKAHLASFYASQVDASTIEEMASYTGQRNGEVVIAGIDARSVLEKIGSRTASSNSIGA